jgi:hypothetical protein
VIKPFFFFFLSRLFHTIKGNKASNKRP